MRRINSAVAACLLTAGALRAADAPAEDGRLPYRGSIGPVRAVEAMPPTAVAPVAVPDAYAVVPDSETAPQVLPVLEQLRASGLSVLMHAGGGSMKSQFKRADASGARVALIFGADELAAGQVAVKPLRQADGSGAAQQLLPLSKAAEWAQTLRNA
jgi:histidyl-tRNA synthetase